VVGAIYGEIISVTAGGAHSCAILDGITECWGRNDVGQLGTGSAGASTGTPTAVVGGHTFAKVSAGGRHTCALDWSGKMWCWGANDFGQLGDSGVSGSSSAAPVAVLGTTIWSDVSAGEDFTCASTNSGDVLGVWCWGRNDRGQVGPLAGDSVSLIPLLAMNGSGETVGTLASGAKFACAAISNGFGVYPPFCWGANDHGQLGRGTTSVSEPTPAVVETGGDAGLSMVVMRAGADFICGEAHDFTERFVCWGRNDKGQFGGGSTGSSSTPIFVQDQY